MFVTWIFVSHFLQVDRYYSYCRCMSERLNVKWYGTYDVVPLSPSFFLGLSNHLPLTYFLLLTYMGMHTIKPMTRSTKNQVFDL